MGQSVGGVADQASACACVSVGRGGRRCLLLAPAPALPLPLRLQYGVRAEKGHGKADEGRGVGPQDALTAGLM